MKQQGGFRDQEFNGGHVGEVNILYGAASTITATRMVL